MIRGEAELSTDMKHPLHVDVCSQITGVSLVFAFLVSPYPQGGSFRLRLSWIGPRNTNTGRIATKANEVSQTRKMFALGERPECRRVYSLPCIATSSRGDW